MVSTREKKLQNKKFLSQTKDSLNDFLLGNNPQEVVVENETVELRNGGYVDNY